MKLKELIREAPLPQEWDKETYNPNVSYKKRIDYAIQKAQKIGSGSSRVAFNIPYEGRDTVLKVAKNAKGLAQNEHEAALLGDYYLLSLNITIPMIDFDEEHEQPLWIHTEKASKVTPTMFKKYFGTDPFSLVQLAKHMTGEKVYTDTSGFQELYENNEHVGNFVNFVGNFGIIPGDFSRLANWGVYQNHIVIIDVGLSKDIYKKFYHKR